MQQLSCTHIRDPVERCAAAVGADGLCGRRVEGGPRDDRAGLRLLGVASEVPRTAPRAEPVLIRLGSCWILLPLQLLALGPEAELQGKYGAHAAPPQLPIEVAG